MEEFIGNKGNISSRTAPEKSAKSKRRPSKGDEAPLFKEKKGNSESGEESYESILQKLVNSKRLSLQGKSSFPQVQPNSLFCVECSKNMLSYVAVLQDILRVVVGDITGTTTESVPTEAVNPVKLECPHCGSLVNNDSYLNSSQQNKLVEKSLPISERKSVPISDPVFSVSGPSSEKNYAMSEGTVNFIPVSNVSQQKNELSSRENYSGYTDTGNKLNEKQVVNNLQKERDQLQNLNVKESKIEIPGIAQTVAEVQQRLANLLPFDERIKSIQIEPKQQVSGIPTNEKEFPFSSVLLPTAVSKYTNQPGKDNKQLDADQLREYFKQHDVDQQKEGSKQRGIDFLELGETELHNLQHTSSDYQRDEQITADAELDEAYVTLATNNISALSSLVLGYSLLAAKTSRTLVVLVTEGVCSELKYFLSTVFNIVQSVESLGAKELTKLSLLEDPELGISFIKLHVWQLKSFRKCVFLDSSTLVVRNCDELFKREELSAVPDIGWPDCFNSGVFVYVPSRETFWDLVDFLESQESYDGGDQGLLNMFFRNWASDISRKLPFIYNMMANVSYTYKPALKQFGGDVKIVHFFGSYNPWNVPFHSVSGDLLPTADVHPVYVQFVKFWLDIFVGCVLPLFDEEILNYCHTRKYATVQELLQFFPSTPMPETFPIQPSFRLYPDSVLEDRSEIASPLYQPDFEEAAVAGDEEKKDLDEDDLTLPGAEVGDYRGMEAWEQGKADYLGLDKSDRIMARLDFLMQDPSNQ